MILIAVLVWFVVATVLTAIGNSVAKDEEEAIFLTSAAMTWPAWGIIAILLSPAILGIGAVALWRKVCKSANTK